MSSAGQKIPTVLFHPGVEMCNSLTNGGYCESHFYLVHELVVILY